MLVQVISASEAKAPADAAPKETTLRVVSTAGLVVPLTPGSPTCNLI